MLRYAALAAVLALIAGATAYLSESRTIEFSALIAMSLSLVLAVTFVILSLDDPNRDPRHPRH